MSYYILFVMNAFFSVVVMLAMGFVYSMIVAQFGMGLFVVVIGIAAPAFLSKDG